MKQLNQDVQKGIRKPWARLLLATGLALASACGNPGSSSPPVPKTDASAGESVMRRDGAGDRGGKADSRRDAKPPADKKLVDLSRDVSKPDAMSACALSSAGSFSGLITAGTPKTVGGYSFDYKGKTGVDAIFDIYCGGAVIATGQKCPLGADTVIKVAQDGKSITISPIAAGAKSVNAGIEVKAI